MDITVLALDIGLKRTGVACGHSYTGSATPAGQLTVTRGRHDWPGLDSLISEWEPDQIVIGDPESSDPHLNKAINRVKSHIQQHHKIPIIDVNERLTSSAANSELAARGLTERRKTEMRDQIAACLILETYFNAQKS
ncbi:Holliday junction resolvase RuvX [Arenicella sp. 4NH20-0111]|uniref:Holliday junction resolvase RuvX n=1 Tax=Arenicella sp. 4NH20-0111 TaxID=3127648 RepID=UPI0031036620